MVRPTKPAITSKNVPTNRSSALPPNEMRLSCAAQGYRSQMQFYYEGRRQLQPLVRPQRERWSARAPSRNPTTTATVKALGTETQGGTPIALITRSVPARPKRERNPADATARHFVMRPVGPTIRRIRVEA